MSQGEGETRARTQENRLFVRFFFFIFEYPKNGEFFFSSDLPFEVNYTYYTIRVYAVPDRIVNYP